MRKIFKNPDSTPIRAQTPASAVKAATAGAERKESTTT